MTTDINRVCILKPLHLRVQFHYNYTRRRTPVARVTVSPKIWGSNYHGHTIYYPLLTITNHHESLLTIFDPYEPHCKMILYGGFLKMGVPKKVNGL